MKANSLNEGWEIAKELVKDATLDKDSTAGYKVYRNEAGEWISDIGTRLECNMMNGNTVNIWIERNASKLMWKVYTCKEKDLAESLFEDLDEAVLFTEKMMSEGTPAILVKLPWLVKIEA